MIGPGRTGRAVGYVRKSADTGEKGEATLETQRQTIRDLCQREGLALVYTYEEGQGVTAALADNRPQWERLLRELVPGTTVVAWHSSRLSRNNREGWFEAEDRGCFVLTGNGVDTWRETSGLTADVNAMMDRHYSRALRQWVRDGKRRQREAGRYMGGVTPFGFRRDAEGRLEVNPEEALVVQELVQRVLGGSSIRAGALWLNEQGITPRKAQLWGATSVSRMLRNDLTPIVGADTYHRLQAVLNGAGRGGGKRRAKAPLTGVLRCSRCGGPMSYDPHQSGGRYSCSRHAGGKCAGVAVVARYAEETILLRFLRVVGSASDETLQELAVRLGAAVADPSVIERRQALEGELATVNAKVRDLGQRFAEGSLDGDLLEMLVGGLQKRRTEIQEALKDLPVPTADPSGLLDWAEGAEGLDEAWPLWEALEPAVRREMLTVVWPEGVTVLPGRRGGPFTEERLAFG